MSLGILINKYFGFLDQRGKWFNFALGLLCTAAVGALDYPSREDVSLAFFYLLPIGFVSWFAGRGHGLAMSVICTATWGAINSYHGGAYPRLWNLLSISGFFIVVAILFSKLREILDREHSQSRTDHLTGAMNSRAFYEIAFNEVLRSSRQKSSFTLAYLDIDNFKEVNDRYGHHSGDRLLQSVVGMILANVRQTDVVARLGGDEFIILLPGTDSEGAHTIVEKVKEHLQIRMNSEKWPVTFSFGVLTCRSTPPTVHEVITLADKLMYDAKSAGKNGIRFGVYKENVVGFSH